MSPLRRAGRPAAPSVTRWDPARLSSRALTYGVLLALIGVAYVVGVVRIDALFGLSSDWMAPPQLVASGLVALVLAPVRDTVARWAERLVYGRRVPRYEVLAEVSALSRATGPAGGTLRSLARITAEGLAVPAVGVHVRLPDGSHTEHRWPEDPRSPSPGHRVPVRYGGEPVGAIGLSEQAYRDLSPDRHRLLEDLTRSAGVLLHNAGLTAELQARLRAIEARSAEIRASRWRIVAAQDAERRDLERDLHDEAQPGLTAVRLALGLLAHLAASGSREAVDRAFDQAGERITDALGQLRRTLLGLDPRLLVGRGLEPALRGRAEALGCRATFDLDPKLAGVRFDPMVEAAVYYCCAEALQNIAKHAADGPVVVTLALDPALGRLCFTVTDQGPGFSVEGAGTGSGLQNMADRVGTVGGALELRSAVGAGTRVAAWVPDVRAQLPDGLVHSVR
ncbi:sensor histidine kinase [Kitasatospora sp. NPDC052896]|uniref:sensor histidine kinase n=1 Tax=Kitasatospora sp. NPDC052896 TaxID=3364061 RepID=UPI0037CC0A4D